MIVRCSFRSASGSDRALGFSFVSNAVSRRRRQGASAWLAVITIGIAGCAPLPPLEGRTASYALQDTATTPLGQVIAPEAAGHPGLTGIESIGDGRVSLGMRFAMLRAATRSVDI